MTHPVDSPFSKPLIVVSSITMYSVRPSAPPRAGATDAVDEGQRLNNFDGGHEAC